MEGTITFDPTVTCKTDLAECFRIFTDPNLVTTEPATRLARPADGHIVDDEQITAYTDGSCIHNGKADARCGSGIWIAHDHELNREIRVPGEKQSNQIGEIVAVIVLLQIATAFAPLLIKTDSRYVIDGLTEHLSEWEDRGWIDVQNSEYFEAAAYHLRKRSAPTDFEWVKGHNNIEGNEQADSSANNGARKLIADELDLTIPPTFKLQGAKLSTITQAIAYRGIRQRKRAKLKTRTTTKNNLESAQSAIRNHTGQNETTRTIWQKRTHKDIRKPIQQFIWKATHGAYRLGAAWSNIPNHEDKAKCSACNDEDESLEHILTDCPVNTRDLVWKLAKDLWPHDEESWPDINLGILLACGNLVVPRRQPNQTDLDARTYIKQGASRLLRTIVSESLYLIWVFRCEREIGKRHHTKQEIISRWTQTISDRLLTDRIVATKIRRHDAEKFQLKDTWNEVLLDPPDDWHEKIEVLVGIKPPSPLL
ncbi:ribonuclease H-like protein [Dentipellis sp. KUC8613]|nr:ribonuclease H-like protein [Dentipellis sp. KUC8613]